MTISVANVDQTTDTFGGLITKTNQLAIAMTVSAVTTNSNTAAGNAAVSNAFTANVLYANTVNGGNTSVSAAIGISSNLYVVPYPGGNTLVITGNTTVGAFTTTVTGNNVTIFPSSTTRISGSVFAVNTATVNVSSVSSFYGNTSIYSNTTQKAIELTGNTTVANLSINVSTTKITSITTAYGNTTIGANATTNNFVVTGNSTHSNVIVSANDIYLSPSSNVEVTSVLYVSNVVNAGNTTITGFANVSTSVNTALYTVGATFTANATLVNAAAINVTNQVNAATLYATTSANVGTLLRANTSAYMVSSNSTVNTVITATSITQTNTTATPLVANVTGIYHTGTINAASLTTTLATVNNAGVYVGANVYVNSTAVFAQSNSTVNTIITAVSITQTNTTATPLVANATGVFHTGTINAASHTTTGVTANVTGVYPASNTSGTALGDTTKRWVVTANTIAASGATTLNNTLAAGNTTVTGFANVSSTLQVDAATTLNSTLAAGNTTVTGFANVSSYLQVAGNTVHNGNVVLGNSSVAVALVANGSTGASQQFLLSNGSAAYWETITNVNVVNALIAYTFSNTITIDTSANNQQNNQLLLKSQNTASITIQGDSNGSANGITSGAFLRLGTEGTANMGFFAIVQEAGNNGIGGAYTGSLANSVLIGTVANSTLIPALQLGVANAVVQTITGGGNTGFGNTTPTDKLRAEGTFSALSSVTISNSTVSALIANTTGLYHTGTVNAASHTTTNFTANNSGVFPGSNTAGTQFGNTIARWVITANTISATGAASITNTLDAGNTTIAGFANVSTSVNTALLSVGALFTANSTLVNAAAINITGQTNTTTLYAATSANVGTLLAANTSAYLVSSNSTVNAILTAISLTLANTTATSFVANGTGLYHAGTINAASITAGSNVSMNTSVLFVGNSTINTYISANLITLNGSNVMTVATTLKVFNAAGTQVFP
jgi:hypothetical protein